MIFSSKSGMFDETKIEKLQDLDPLSVDDDSFSPARIRISGQNHKRC